MNVKALTTAQRVVWPTVSRWRQDTFSLLERYFHKVGLRPRPTHTPVIKILHSRRRKQAYGSRSLNCEVQVGRVTIKEEGLGILA